MGAIVINRQSLDFFIDKNQFHLDFPPEALTNLEIVDRNLFKKLLDDFVLNHQIKKQSIVVLYNSEAVFEKAFVKDENLTANLKKFYEEVPLPVEKVLKKEFDQEATVLAVAVNKEILDYFVLLDIIWVVPLGPLGYKEFDLKVLNNHKKLREFSLLQTEKPLGKLSKLVIIEIGALTFGLIVCSFIIYNSFFKTSTPKSEIIIKPTVENKVVEEVKQDDFINKKDLTISVLNASGKAGLAAKVKTALELAEFEQIITGNATESASSIINYSQGLKDNDLQTILGKLKDLGFNVATGSASISADLNVQIILGKE